MPGIHSISFVAISTVLLGLAFMPTPTQAARLPVYIDYGLKSFGQEDNSNLAICRCVDGYQDLAEREEIWTKTLTYVGQATTEGGQVFRSFYNGNVTILQGVQLELAQDEFKKECQGKGVWIDGI
ncbi:hypothetical protein IE53DRAFT_391318 [Violaceomyces palustris]|uniref:Uncharacterized protein n=1 Tax=Violaceomyces palustris TaxID=1673888 RepID=A0ACD0NL51_9BASI|nr:hypothetical protein IE53DRAFT_391318 [Violaceomyces palustris]